MVQFIPATGIGARAFRQRCQFHIGEAVLIVEGEHPDLDGFVGRRAAITDVARDERERYYCPNVAGGRWAWGCENLTFRPEEPSVVSAGKLSCLNLNER